MKKLFTTACDDAHVHALHVHVFAYSKIGSLCFINFHIGSQTANAGAEKRCEFPGSFYLSQKTY